MPAFHAHHCPFCSRIGDKRCIAVGHYVDCPTHAGSFHPAKTTCVKCAAALRREERETLRGKENDAPPEGVHASQKHKKKPKKGSVKSAHEKGMKQVHHEKQAASKSQGTSTCTTEEKGEGRSSPQEVEVWLQQKCWGRKVG